MFKLVCGAGNEDTESVKRLVYVYASAGCKLFDLSARKEILSAAKEGAALAESRSDFNQTKTENGDLPSPENQAFTLIQTDFLPSPKGGEEAECNFLNLKSRSELPCREPNDIQYCVSIGIKGDKHITKAKIGEKCTKCGACANSCPNDAILPDIMIDEKKCIGCGDCIKACPSNAIYTVEKDVNYREILPYMVKNGVYILELHIMGHDKSDLAEKWKVINECKPKFASICIDRENFGNKEVLSRIREMISVREPYTTIIQADGVPMSGGSDDYKTTLQAVAMAEVIQNANLPVYIMLSGGTNSKTAELARLCGINFQGIAIGSWARKIVKPYVSRGDFWENQTVQNEAVKHAKNLIDHCR